MGRERHDWLVNRMEGDLKGFDGLERVTQSCELFSIFSFFASFVMHLFPTCCLFLLLPLELRLPLVLAPRQAGATPFFFFFSLKSGCQATKRKLRRDRVQLQITSIERVLAWLRWRVPWQFQRGLTRSFMLMEEGWLPKCLQGRWSQLDRNGGEQCIGNRHRTPSERYTKKPPMAWAFLL